MNTKHLETTGKRLERVFDNLRHFVLLKTINGIKDRIDNMYSLGNDDTQYVRNEFLEYLRHLMDLVNELHKEDGIRK